MKVSVEIDLSPQEARELMGWPDVIKFHETMLNSLQVQLAEGNNENLNALLQPFLAESQRAFSSYQKLMEGFFTISTNTNNSKD